jgi:Asp/Glu/hydantoin racemase
MTIVKGGKRFYGQAIGIILLDTLAPRLLGDIGNASSFDFPVKLKYVEGLEVSWIVNSHPDIRALPLLIHAAKELEIDGVKAITTSCGFTSVFQKDMANAVKIPVFASSLIQIPIIHQMLGDHQKIGIITADSTKLGKEHLQAAGVNDSVSVCIAGVQNGEEWKKRIQDMQVNPLRLEKEIAKVANSLVLKNPDIGAIVLECTNLPSFAFAIQKVTDLPVFDIFTLTKMIYESLFRKSFFNQRDSQFFNVNRFI